MEEKILMEGLANPLSKRGFAFKNGKGVLTNKRFIYFKHKLSKTLTVGLWVNFTEGDFEYDIPLEKIEKVQIESKGIRGNVLHLYVEGEPVRKFGVAKALEWEVAFGNASADIVFERI